MALTVQFTCNNQTTNQFRLARLKRSIAEVGPGEIVEQLSKMAVQRLREVTPKGRTARIASGWTYETMSSGHETSGHVFNTNEDDPKGETILNVLEKGAMYKSTRIFPVHAKALAFFWERYGAWYILKSVEAIDKRGFHMVKNTHSWLEGFARQVADMILARHVRDSLA